MPAVLCINDYTRKTAREWIDKAPDGSLITFERPRRTLDQNAKLWALLTDISRAQPRGIQKTPEAWKALMMHACGHEVQFEMGLNGEPFPVGFRSSKMNKEQMSELIEFIISWGTQEGVRFSDEVSA